MKKKLILSVLAIIMVLGLAGAGTLAYFVDTETSTGNTYTAGSFDLKISDADEGFRDGVTATWTMTNMAPGVNVCGNFITLQNSGSIAGDHVEISFSHVIDDTPDVVSDTNWSSEPEDLAKWIQITMMEYNIDGVWYNWVTGFIPGNADRDPNGNNFLDLDDVSRLSYSGEGGFLDNLPAPGPNNSTPTTFTMDLIFNLGATNDIQGDTLNTTVSFTLNQEASQ